MANSEDTLVDELRKALAKIKGGAFVYKLHGGPFQSGLPDLLIAMERNATLVEAKWSRDDSDCDKPFLDLISSKLTPQQALNLHTIAALGGPLRARILIGVEVSGDPSLRGGHGVLAVAFDVADITELKQFTSLTLGELAQYALDRRRGEDVRLGCGHLLTLQLRGDGEEWQAVPLLIGNSYWVPGAYLSDDTKIHEDA